MRALTAAFLAVVFLGVAPTRAEEAAAPAARAAAWIVSQQSGDGSFFGQSANGVAETVASLAAAGVRGAAIQRALHFVSAHGPADATRAAYAGRIAMGIAAAGENPRSFGGFDYVAKVKSFYNAATGAYENGIYSDALAILGLAAAGVKVPAQAITFLRANQCSDGGFGHDAGCVSQPDVDTTAVGVCALIANGVPASDPAIVNARGWLREMQASGGGFPHQAGQDVNANSTGLALSAIAAIGDHDGAGTWRNNTAALLALRTANGAFKYRAADPAADGYSTVQAIPGVVFVAYPIRYRAPAPTVAPGATVAASAKPSVTPCPSPSARPAARVLHAGLVVEFGDGSVKSFCIAFTGALTGIDLLRRSGLPVTYGGTRDNAGVCSIAGDGCTSGGGQCFCQCPDTTAESCRFWGYYTRRASDAWVFSSLGASKRIVRDGDVDGWRYANHKGGKTWPPASPPPCANPKAQAIALPTRSTDMIAVHHSSWPGYALALIVLAALAGGGVVALKMRDA